MLKKIIKKILRHFGYKLQKLNRKLPQSFVNEEPTIEEIKCIIKSKGILHLGAHRGKEAEIYQWFNKNVIWIEANPHIFEDLYDHIKYYYNQKAINVLLGDQKKKTKFYIANRDSASSSIYDFSDEVKKGELWSKKNISMVHQINLEMTKLDDVLKKNKIPPDKYNHWILDLQGAEYLVLKGAEESIEHCRSMMIEISQKNFYEPGSSKWLEIKKFLEKKGFRLIHKPLSDHCDVLFERKI